MESCSPGRAMGPTVAALGRLLHPDSRVGGLDAEDMVSVLALVGDRAEKAGLAADLAGVGRGRAGVLRAVGVKATYVKIKNRIVAHKKK